jgi:hypothetical protein
MSNSEGAPIYRAYSTNCGATWSSIANVNAADANLQGSQPVFLPNGNLVIVYWNFGSSGSPGERLEAVISSDGGVTFGPPKRIASATEYNEPNIRTGSFLPSAVSDRTNGNLFVACQAIRKSYSRNRITAARAGAPPSQLATIRLAPACSIPRSMFRPTVKR